ncbi:MAG TPA: methyltransferase domain-containing protein [Ramlibacter sp.]|uniref:methyltransferase domain-containing protein n=1 Tax=Ramlibacter sp. TaxID=1917967 RepID=UPI002BDF197A|nr:methyltransferase domain-containing protein [Ramlibacter sp.]HVZ47063.1 methyltransferase domain-containing protein [Ramlibacter sp.]
MPPPNALITDDYRRMQAELHAKGDYGTVGAVYGPLVTALVRSTGATSLLDYGCGSQRSLLRTLQLPAGVVYEGYDPAVAQYAAPPVPAELVCCIDVLEHIEPDLLDNVLDHLATLCDPYGFFTTHSGPAAKVLSDGRNAHLTQQGPAWWIARLERDFRVLEQRPVPGGMCVMVSSRRSDVPVDPGAHAPLSGFSVKARE